MNWVTADIAAQNALAAARKAGRRARYLREIDRLDRRSVHAAESRHGQYVCCSPPCP